MSLVPLDRIARLACCAPLLVTVMLAGCSSPKPEAPSASSALASSQGKALAESTVLFEATGTGTVYTIDTDPPQAERVENVTLPWQATSTIGSDVTMLQVVVVGKNDGDAGPGCRITLDGKVVAEEPIGGSAHCIYQMP